MSSGSRILTKEEVKQVLDHFKSTNSRNYAAALMSVSIGTRITELLSLRWKDLDGKYVNVKSLKGSNNASFPMSDELLKALNQLKQHYYNIGVQIDDNTHLFLSREGANKPLSSQHWNFIIRDACRKLGISGKVSNHSFRKCFITRIYEITGKDIFRTKVFSRHKSVSSLTPYVHASGDTSIVETIEWSKLDDKN